MENSLERSHRITVSFQFDSWRDIQNQSGNCSAQLKKASTVILSVGLVGMGNLIMTRSETRAYIQKLV